MAGSPNSKRSSRSMLLTVAAIGVTASFFLAFAQGARAETAQGTESRALVNQARAQAGLASLEVNPGLGAIAQAQADRMAARDAIYHNPNLKSDADAAGVNWELIGENVGVGPSVADVHQAFMNSPGHRENIVYPDYNAIGVGIAAAKDGSVFVAHAYAKVAASAPAPVATQPQNTSPATASQPVVASTDSTVPAVNDAAPATSATPEKTDAPAVNAVVGGIVNTAPVF